MGKGTEREEKIRRDKVSGCDRNGNSPDCAQSNGPAYVSHETGCFILHRIGPAREWEKLYGPYMDKTKARSKLSEYVEHFVRERAANEPRTEFISDEYARVRVTGYASAGTDTFHFLIKRVGY